MTIDNQYPCLRINAPELRRHDKFVAWLDRASEGRYADIGPVASWHRPWLGNGRGEINDYSDIFIWKDSGYEGSNSDMPEDVWNQLVQLAGEEFTGVLWIDFLEG